MRDVDQYCSGISNGSQRPQSPRSLPTEVSESQDFYAKNPKIYAKIYEDILLDMEKMVDSV